MPASSCMTTTTTQSTLTVNLPTLASAGLPRPPPHPLTEGGFSTTAAVPITTAVTAPPQSTPSPQISAPATPSICTTMPENSNAVSSTAAASTSPSLPPVTPFVVAPLQNSSVTHPSFPELTNEPLCQTDPAGSSTTAPAPASGQGLDVVDAAVAMLGSAADGRESQPLERQHPRRVRCHFVTLPYC